MQLRPRVGHRRDTRGGSLRQHHRAQALRIALKRGTKNTKNTKSLRSVPDPQQQLPGSIVGIHRRHFNATVIRLRTLNALSGQQRPGFPGGGKSRRSATSIVCHRPLQENCRLTQWSHKVPSMGFQWTNKRPQTRITATSRCRETHPPMIPCAAARQSGQRGVAGGVACENSRPANVSARCVHLLLEDLPRNLPRSTLGDPSLA
jgi:hypothetical protein